jgi:hypothetical protein
MSLAATGTELIKVAESADDFVAQVVAAITPDSDAAIDARTEYARAFGWDRRGELLRGIAAKAAGHRPVRDDRDDVSLDRRS